MAAGVAVVGAVVLATTDDDACYAIATRMAQLDLLPEQRTAAQRWDDIYTLQTDVTEGLQLRHQLELHDCT
jgi:hypothetical protein